MRHLMAYSRYPAKYYQILNGKELVFRSDMRPAPRYLYFRYLMAYIYNSIRPTVNQVLDLEQNIWRTAVPQPLVRRSLLRLLATKYEFSKTFCDNIDSVSFETSEGSHARTSEQELMMISALVSGVLELVDEVFCYSTASESNSDDSEDPN
ncbi:hypothetical protein BJX66DRAFT_35959 [Aspergillus keveii]|uniref:Uncharacterized protein n=1 Tax=Aspergillus keveii TaxID=714993 RepID=A0ABR4GJ59_9EURO